MIDYFKYLVQMTRDIFQNLRRIYSLAKFEYKLTNKGMALGQLWLVLNPLIQIGVYWFVFGVGIRNGNPVGEYPYVVWLTCGVAPWLICSRGISLPASSIYSKASMLTRSNIPTCLIPLSVSLSTVMDSRWTVAIMIVIYLGNGCMPTWNMLCLIYYMFCILAFTASLSLITSVLGMLARDFLNLIQAALRMIFFISPIFWDPGTSTNEVVRQMAVYNPFGYIIDGFRDAMLYRVPFWEDMRGMRIFWSTVLVLYLLGAAFQRKLRKNLLDFI